MLCYVVIEVYEAQLMRWGLIVLGLIAILIGGVWFLQGIGILLGSPMTSVPLWEFLGAVLVIVGLVLIIVGVRGRRRSADKGN